MRGDTGSGQSTECLGPHPKTICRVPGAAQGQVSPHFSVCRERHQSSAGAIPAWQLSLQPVAIGAAESADIYEQACQVGSEWRRGMFRGAGAWPERRRGHVPPTCYPCYAGNPWSGRSSLWPPCILPALPALPALSASKGALPAPSSVEGPKGAKSKGGEPIENTLEPPFPMAYDGTVSPAECLAPLRQTPLMPTTKPPANQHGTR
jgi:hypothetical protein